MQTRKVVVLEGDGIGPEIMVEGLKVLGASSTKHGNKIDLVYHPFGAKAFFEYGHPFPEQTKTACREADAILKGTIGVSLAEMSKIPVEFSPEGAGLLPLRKMLDTYANYRPIFLAKSMADISPLRPEVIGDGLDILMMRELVGGIYFGAKVEGAQSGMTFAQDDCTYTREQITRFANVCFREAKERNALLTNVHKKNVLATSRFWNAIFNEVKQAYPDVRYQERLVDDVAFQLVKNPRQFNGVMAFENMQGDIITDQGGGIMGSLGFMPSACLNPETGNGYFEPAHGSAPDIAGKGIANPYSMIGSVAFMLDKAFGLKREAREIWDGLTDVLARGYRTQEVAGANTPKDKILTTSQFGDLVTRHILEAVN